MELAEITTLFVTTHVITGIKSVKIVTSFIQAGDIREIETFLN